MAHQPQQQQPDLDQFQADLESGLAKMAEAAATRTSAVLRPAEVHAVLTVLRAASGAAAERPPQQPGDRR